MDIVTYALSKKYTDNSIAGGGAVKGKNCTVSSIVQIPGGNRVTFQWTLDNGTVQTDSIDVMDGEIGPQGIQGPQGVQGPRGLQGVQGIQGVAGAKGDKGDKGDTGNTGAKGADGAAATIQIGAVSSGASPSVVNVGTSQNAVFDFTLPKGDKGDKGDKGADGADGKSFEIKAQFPTEAALRAAHPTGNAGDAYFVGADSNPDLYVWLTDENDWFNNGKIAGVKGDKGDKGDEGFSPVASVSKSGAVTTVSIRDKVGQTTATISDGTKGVDGKSAYEVAVDNGFVGTEADWLQSLIGQQGPKGDQGDPGAQGLQGPQGDPGTTNYNDLINKPTLGTAAEKDSTDRVSPNNRGLVESQSVYSAITTALASIYTPAGDLTCAELTSDLLVADNVGKVYELSDNGTTSDLFLQGADHPLVVGDQIGIINAGRGRILFNYMANRIDLSAFQKRDLAQAIEGATTVEGALGALSSGKVSTDLVPSDASASNKLVTESQLTTGNIELANNAGAHNSIYRGKYLGSQVTAEQYAQISAGTFNDLFIGDYWTIGDVNYRIAAFDYWFNTNGSPRLSTTHHVVLVPDSVLYKAPMYSSSATATEGYIGSLMYTSKLGSAKDTINRAFGSTHILKHKDYFSYTSSREGGATACKWVDSTVDIMNECMVFGHRVQSSSPREEGIDHTQLPLFALSREHLAIGAIWWLRDMFSSYTSSGDNGFINVNSEGIPYRGAWSSTEYGVRPAFAIKG